MKFDKEKFKKDIQKKRIPKLHSQYKSVRVAAKEAKVQFSSFHRVECGKIPSIQTFTRICAWLKQHPKEYFKN